MSAGRRKLKVVTLIDQLTMQGGAERVASQLAMRIDPERFESTICATRFDPANPDGTEPIVQRELAAHGVAVVGLGRRQGKLDLHRLRGLATLLRRERVDVLHAHMFTSNVYGALLGRLARVPVVISHEHSWSFEGEPVRQLLDRHVIARMSDRFIAVSREDERRMIEIEGVRPEKIEVVPNGIEAMRATGTDVRAELGIEPGAPLIGSVGVLRPEKAFDVLAAAVKVLLPAHPDLKLAIVGDGWPEPVAALEAAIESLGVTDAVKLVGFRGDIPDFLAALDVAVTSSLREGSPLSVMEYMGAGKPIVATRVGGVPDLIDDGEHGLLVPPGDADALAAAIGRLLNDRALADRLGRSAAERCAREFSFDVAVRRFEDLYESLYARSARARREGFVAGAAAAVA
jgi:glycosyltransferase involved in cell wall biosynthesis